MLTPMEFMQRLAALVLRPRLHLIRFDGVLTPNAGLRAVFVQGPPEKSGEHAHSAPARLLKRVFAMDLEHYPQCGGDMKIIATSSTGSGQA